MSEWYIEHSQGPWKNHKYIRIDKIKGIPRYIYDEAGGSAKKKLEEKDQEYRKAEEEYDAAKNMTAQELANRGVSVEERGKKAESAGKAASEAVQAYNKTALGKAERAKDTVKDAGSFVKNKATELVSHFSSNKYKLFNVSKSSTNTSASSSNRPKSREKRKVEGQGTGAYKRGSGLNLGGSVGNGDLYKRKIK